MARILLGSIVAMGARGSASVGLSKLPGTARVRRFHVVAVGLLVAALVVNPAGAIPGFALPAPAGVYDAAFFPTQSLGNQGTDVEAIQYLLAHHVGFPCLPVPLGAFGSLVEACVKLFQASVGRTPTGIVDAGTWKYLITDLGPGDQGYAVRALQNELAAKMGSVFKIQFLGYDETGTYGFLTEAAVKEFQAHTCSAGGSFFTCILAILPEYGEVRATTWRWLLWHYERPAFGSNLCAASTQTSNGDLAKWGTAAAIRQLEKTASSFASTGNGPVAVRDISLEHGGDIAGHASHENGLDIDILTVRLSSDQCTAGLCNYYDPCYDAKGTRALVEAIRSVGGTHVQRILFNDPVLIAAGLVTGSNPTHDYHIHLHYCEAIHPVRTPYDYQC